MSPDNERNAQMQLFKNSRMALATAMTSAALDGDPPAPAAAQVTVADATPAAAGNGLTVEQIYARSSAAVVEIAVSAGPQQSQGSGFVYDDDGHVITNQHVVDAATSAKVTFS